MTVAKALCGLKGVRRMKGKRRVAYYALLLDRHEVIFADGVATESFRPGPVALADFSPLHRAQIFRIYPGLVDDPMQALGPPARMFVKPREVRGIIEKLRRMGVRTASAGVFAGVPLECAGQPCGGLAPSSMGSAALEAQFLE